MGYKQKGWSAFTKKKDKKNMAEGIPPEEPIFEKKIRNAEKRVEHVNVPTMWDKYTVPTAESRVVPHEKRPIATSERAPYEPDEYLTKPEKKVNKRKVVKTVIKNKTEKKSKRRYADGGIETNKLWWEREKR